MDQDTNFLTLCNWCNCAQYIISKNETSQCKYLTFNSVLFNIFSRNVITILWRDIKGKNVLLYVDSWTFFVGD